MTISRSVAAISASSSIWRSSVRLSRSPTWGSRSTRSSPSRTDLRGNSPSSSPSRQTTRCGTERIGTSVQIVRWPVRKLVRVGRPSSRAASSARTSASASVVASAPATAASRSTSSSSRCSSARCHASRPAVAVSASAAAAIAAVQPPTVIGLRIRVERRLQAVDQLREAAGEVDRPALDVVEREHAAEQPLLLVGHRDAEQHAVQARAPGAGGQLVELEGRAMGGVEPPADPRLRDPLLHARDVVVVEPEAPAHRLAVGEIEHLRGGQALVGELEQARDEAEHRVGLSQRAVGEADAQVGRAQLLRQVLELVVLGRDLAGAERRADQRRERLDVRAHDDHVARLERRVLGELVQDRVAQHLDLAGAAVAGVDLDAAVAAELEPLVGLTGERRAGRWAVGAHVGLDAREQRAGRGGRSRGGGRRPRAGRRRAAARARPGPRRRAAGWPAARA